MKAAFHQIPIHPDSVKFTAYICEFGLYEYLSMPMGISSAPAWFQRFIESILQDFVIKEILSVYLDDIIIFSAELEVHVIDVLAVIERLQEKNMKTSFENSQFDLVTEQIEFLGNVIEGGEIRAHPKRAKCLKEMKRPETLAELQRLLGMTNYSRTYIPNYAEITKPLYDLMDIKNVPDKLLKRNGAPNGKKVILKWTAETIQAFDKLVEIMCSDLVLRLPNLELDFEVTCDASDLGYAAVLEQEFDSEDRSIAFYFKCYTKSQHNYSTSEKELLCIVMAVENCSFINTVGNSLDIPTINRSPGF